MVPEFSLPIGMGVALTSADPATLTIQTITTEPHYLALSMVYLFIEANNYTFETQGRHHRLHRL
jgi:hypothetical protein